MGVADAIVLMLIDVKESDSSSGLIKDILNCKETEQRVKKYTKYSQSHLKKIINLQRVNLSTFIFIYQIFVFYLIFVYLTFG